MPEDVLNLLDVNLSDFCVPLMTDCSWSKDLRGTGFMPQAC